MDAQPTQSRSTKVLALLFANGINLAISFLTLPYLARSLSYEEYGSYGQLNLLGSLFTILFGLGSVQIVNILFAESREDEHRVFSSNFFLYIFSGTLCLIALFLLRQPIAEFMNNGLLVDLLPIYAVGLFFQIASTIYTTTIVYFERIKQLATATVFTNIVRISLLVVAITIFRSLLLAVVALSVAAAFQAVWYFLIIPKKIRRLNVFDKRLIVEQLKLSYPLLIVSLLGTGIVTIDGLLVSNFLSVKDFAIYRAGAIEVPFISTIYVTIGTILMPDIARLATERKGDEILSLYRRASSITAIVIFPLTLFLIVFGKEFITLYLSDKYAESGIVFSIYSIVVLTRITFYQGILLAYKKSKLILLGFTIGFLFNLAANVIMIPRLGPEGAAAAYVISGLFLPAWLVFFSAKTAEQKIGNYFDWPFLAMLGGVCIILLVPMLYFHRSFPNYVLLALMFGCYATVIVASVKVFRSEYYQIFAGLVWDRITKLKRFRPVG